MTHFLEGSEPITDQRLTAFMDKLVTKEKFRQEIEGYTCLSLRGQDLADWYEQRLVRMDRVQEADAIAALMDEGDRTKEHILDLFPNRDLRERLPKENSQRYQELEEQRQRESREIQRRLIALYRHK